MKTGKEIFGEENLHFIEEAELKREIEQKASTSGVSNPIKDSLLKFHRLKKFNLKDLT